MNEGQRRNMSGRLIALEMAVDALCHCLEKRDPGLSKIVKAELERRIMMIDPDAQGVLLEVSEKARSYFRYDHPIE